MAYGTLSPAVGSRSQRDHSGWSRAGDPWVRLPRTQGDFDIELPPATGGADQLAPGTLHALADLYLLAELEQAGVIPAAEALVDARASLQLPTEQLAETLERFAQAERSWYDRKSREQLFARVFGTGAAATSATDGSVNLQFEQLLATLCASIERFAMDQGRFGGSPTTDLAAIGEAANALLSNLGLRQYGNTLFAVKRLHDELTAAIALMSDPGIQSIFGARGFWQVLERILAPNVPDVSRLVERGQSGRVILTWLGDGAASAGAPIGSLPQAILEAAARWLAASGVSAGSVAGSAAGAAPARSVA